MLSLMRNTLGSRRPPSLYALGTVALALFAAASLPPVAVAQSCITQSKMTPEQRTGAGETAYRLANAIGKGDAAGVQAATIAQYAANFDPTANLIRATSSHLSSDTFAVTQVYLLDASNRSPGDSSDADFSCPLTGSAAETDFSIAGLPQGKYAFVMVEASGPNPWLLSFLLQGDASGGWKMAGFYPHRREAAGHAGLWYWTMARADAKSGKPWLAWTMYGEADELLRPANFVSSTNLDRLRTETHGATPPALSGGLSDSTPLALPGPNGAEFRITSLKSEASEDGKQLNLVVHLRAEALTDANAATARNMAAGSALLTAHPELRQGFDNLWVIADVPNVNPFVTERPIGEFTAVK